MPSTQLSPALLFRPSLGQAEKVAAHVVEFKRPVPGPPIVGPTSCIRRSGRSAECATVSSSEVRAPATWAERLGDRVNSTVEGDSEHPQMPALTRLALYLHELSPAGLVCTKPTILAQQGSRLRRPPARAPTSGRQLPQSSRDRPRREPTPWLASSCSSRWLGRDKDTCPRSPLPTPKCPACQAADSFGLGRRRHDAGQDPATTAGKWYRLRRITRRQTRVSISTTWASSVPGNGSRGRPQRGHFCCSWGSSATSSRASSPSRLLRTWPRLPGCCPRGRSLRRAPGRDLALADQTLTRRL